MLDRFRALLVALEEGSLNRAAARLHISQPALSRQIQSLEEELGGRLLERLPSGVQPTALGHETVARLRPVLDRFDTTLTELRSIARGHRRELRVGFIGSAAHCYLTPALIPLRRAHEDVKVKLLDLTPGEQIRALRAGEIDLAMIGQEGAPLAREFHTRLLASLGVLVVLPHDHRLAKRKQLALAELRSEGFIGAPESAAPGRNRWVTRLCRAAGFRPKFLGNGDSIDASFSLVVSEGAVTLVPAYFKERAYPGLVLIPVSDPGARWQFLLMWQRGRSSPPATTLVEALLEVARRAAAKV